MKKTRQKITDFLEEETGGKSYKAHKYSLDADDRPRVEYGSEHRDNVWKDIKETVRHTRYVDLRSLSLKSATQDNSPLVYFLDGSRRVFKVDHMGYTASGSGSRSEIFPIIAGQIGVGCCKRIKRKMHPEKFLREIVVVVPDKADADGNSSFLPYLAQKITQDSGELRRLGINISAVLSYKTSKDDTDVKYEDKATAQVQDRMYQRERDMVAELVREDKLSQDSYLIKDGSLEYRPTKEEKRDPKKLARFKSNYSFVLGVSKNFNPAVCRDINNKPNPGFIADLPPFHRTPVACFENVEFFGDIQFAVWYVRIREIDKTRSPFDGVLKIEKMITTSEEREQGIDSDLVDMLTACIINERNPVCYGADLRWANHLYPVYLAESFVKSKYISTESFLQLF